MEARQVPPGLAARPQESGDEQPAEPRRMLQRFEPTPRVGGDRRRQRRRQCAGLVDDRAPVTEAFILVPVEVVDQRVALRLCLAPTVGLAGERAIGLRDRGVDRGEHVGHPVVGRGHTKRLSCIRLAVFNAERRVPFLLPIDALVLLVALPSPPAQAGEPGGRQRPAGVGVGDPAPSSQHGMRPCELMGRGADIHAGVVENQIFEVDQLTFEPQTGAGIGIMGARDPALADRAFGEPLVEPGERIFGGGERADELGPGQRIGVG